MARPSKLTAEVQERLCTAMRAGNYAEAACRLAGISPSTYYRWCERGEREPDGPYHDFVEAVALAEAESEIYAVTIVRRAMSEDWHAAISFLERRHPRRWQRRQATELSGPDGTPIYTRTQPTLDLSRLTDTELATMEALYARATHSD